jgi:hypothetical protein
MAIFKKKRQAANASEIMEIAWEEEAEFAFNMVLVAPLIAKALRSDDPVGAAAGIIMSEENVVVDYLSLPGLSSMARVIGNCCGMALRDGITPEQFDGYLTDP